MIKKILILYNIQYNRMISFIHFLHEIIWHSYLISEYWEAQPSKVVVPGTQTVSAIANLHPATSYHFRILAENKLGFSDPSEIIQVSTQEEGLNIYNYKKIF